MCPINMIKAEYHYIHLFSSYQLLREVRFFVKLHRLPVTALSSIFLRDTHLCPDCGITVGHNAISAREHAKLVLCSRRSFLAKRIRYQCCFVFYSNYGDNGAVGLYRKLHKIERPTKFLFPR